MEAAMPDTTPNPAPDASTQSNANLPTEPTLYQGGCAVDARGSLMFVNPFDFAGVKRFYTVSNHRQGFVRAWHAHRHQSQYFTVVQGSVLIGAVKIDDWETPDAEAPVSQIVLSAAKPQVYFIPQGHAIGWMSLTTDAILQCFSTATFDECKDDDIRFDARHWDIWQVTER